MLTVNPSVFFQRIDNDFYALVNPIIDDSLKLINKKQYEVLKYFSSDKSLEQIAQINKLDEFELNQFVDLFTSEGFLLTNEEIKEKEFRKKPNAINLWIETTNKCNLACTYCYIHTKDNAEMSETVYSRLYNQIVETVKNNKLKIVYLRWAGGEPLICFNDWKDWVIKLRLELIKIKCKLNLNILTNGTLFNQEIIDYIKKYEIGVGISLDGIGIYHDKTRKFHNGEGSYEKVKMNLDLLKSQNVKFGIMTVISNDNIDNLYDFTEFLIQNNYRFRYSFIDGSSIDYNKVTSILKDCFVLFETSIKKGYDFFKLFHFCDLKFQKKGFVTCAAGFNGGAIYTDGNFYLCQKDFGVNTPLGSIFDETDLVETAQRGKSRIEDLDLACNTCNFKYICTGGCPLERVKGKNLECELFKFVIPEYYKLAGLERLYKISK